MTFRTLRCAAAAAFALAIFAPIGALAQQFPTHTITVVVPNAPGGPNDFLARMMAAKLEPKLGQSLVVENRPGGGTYTGGAYVAHATPDGYTLLVNAYSGMQPHLFVKGLELNLTQALVPVAALSETPYLLFGPASVPANNLKEFIAYAKTRPGKLNVAVYPGTANSLEIQSFLKSVGADLTPVSYGSTAAIITAMLRDDVQIYNGGISGPKAQMEAGKLHGFAVTAKKRDPAVPNIPSTHELGYDWDSSVYYAVFAPSRTPAGTVNLLNQQINTAMHEPDVVERLNTAGSPVAAAASPQQLAARLAKEAATLEREAREQNIQPQ